MAEFDWHKLKVLVLDGDNAFAAWAKEVLLGRGVAEVRSSASATEGFHLLRDFAVQVVLVETKMPDVSGVDFVRWVRSPRHSPNTDLPLVLTTARPEAAILRHACEIGIESFMQKPIEAEKFLRRLATTVRQPRRFVIGGSYFGPDRRREQQAYDGADRRISRVLQGESTYTPREPTPDPAWAAMQMQQTAVAAAIQVGSRPAPHQQNGDPEWPSAPVQSDVVATMVSRTGDEAAAPAADAAVASRPAKRRAASGAASTEVRRPPVAPAIDLEAAKRDKAREAERWKRMLGDDATAAKPEPIDLEAVIANHGDWLKSKGGTGKRALLNGADLSGADLNGAMLANADLQDAILSGATCREADFQGADMRRVNLASADVSSGNLGVARLRHADLQRTNLDGANLRGSDLAGANLRGASLNEADLGGANLLSTDLRETDLSGTRGLTQVQIAKVRADSSTLLPPGLRLPRQDG